jgi:hypothetical protein
MANSAGPACSWISGGSKQEYFFERVPRSGSLDRPADDLCIEYGRPAPALGCILVGKLSIRLVVSLTDLVRQPSVHEKVGFATKFCAQCPIFGLPFEGLFQSASREVFTPK